MTEDCKTVKEALDGAFYKLCGSINDEFTIMEEEA